ncbi:hypothetical protein K2Q00_03345 [Patescibacteria group bacterium]|nr:hypothetical protein [Patescibacteria group bacterium]
MSKSTVLRHPLAAQGAVIHDVRNFKHWVSLWDEMWKKTPVQSEYAEGLLHAIFSPTHTISELREVFHICAVLADGHNCERYFVAEGEKYGDFSLADIDSPHLNYHPRCNLARRAWRELCNNMFVRDTYKSQYTLAQLYDFSQGMEPNVVAEDMLRLFHPSPPYMTSPDHRNFYGNTKEAGKHIETFKRFLRELWCLHDPERVPKYLRELRVRSIPHLVWSGMAPELMRDTPEVSMEDENWPYDEILEYLKSRIAFGAKGLLSKQLASGSELTMLYIQFTARRKLHK